MTEMFGKEYIVKVTDDGECITVGELVRCKECKWNTADEWVHCAMVGSMFGRTTDNYCSRAERKEE